MEDTAGISVLIRTKDSAKTLCQLIPKLGLAGQDELIVVDSGSRDCTLSIAKEAGAKLVQPQGPFNYSKSLNIGFETAANPWVLVLSSHCIPVAISHLAGIKTAAEAFPDNLAVAYGALLLAPKTPLTSFRNLKGTCFDLRQWERHNQWLGSNSNALYRRAFWEKHHFDETLITAEDLEWFLWALREGFLAAELADFSVLYRNQGSLRHMFAKGFNESRAAKKMLGYSRISIRGLSMGLGSLAKALLLMRISPSTFLRQSAHKYGAFVGSRKDAR